MTVNHNGINATRDGKAVWEPDAEPATPQTARDAVLAAAPASVSVPPPAPRVDDRAGRVAVLAEVADWLKVWRPEFFERWAIAEQERYEGGVDDAAAELRRMADEAQQPERPRFPHCGLPHDLTPSMELACASIRASFTDRAAAVSGPCVAGETQPYTCAHCGQPITNPEAWTSRDAGPGLPQLYYHLADSFPECQKAWARGEEPS